MWQDMPILNWKVKWEMCRVLQLMNSKNFVNRLMIHHDCFYCRDLAQLCFRWGDTYVSVSLWTQTEHRQVCECKNRHQKKGKCRQNSNLLITYLFFTFVREACGGWRAGDVTGHHDGILWKEALSLEGATHPSKALDFFFSHLDKLKLHFTEVSLKRQGLLLCPHLNPCAQIGIAHINPQRSRQHSWQIWLLEQSFMWCQNKKCSYFNC